MELLPSKNSTVPGRAPPELATTAVSVTSSPEWDGDRLLERLVVVAYAAPGGDHRVGGCFAAIICAIVRPFSTFVP